MSSSVYRNVSFATVATLDDLFRLGAPIEVRDASVHELRNRVTVLTHPKERCLFVPNRMNDVFASLAETLWVLAGRNDIEWLAAYLPRASDYSDDGVTWRGGYGPRLRNWSGVDQVAETLRILKRETASRRAAMSLFDPQRDFAETKDVPCNNWFHWMIRDSRLHLSVAVRSNDVIWGFSGINSFCWSVLQEMMAFWLDVEVGDATYFASSMHIYDRHVERSKTSVHSFRGVTCYEYGLVSPKFKTPFAAFDGALQEWFNLERDARLNPDVKCEAAYSLDDPLLRTALQLMHVYHGSRIGWDLDTLAAALANIPPTDLTAAAYEYFGRSYPALRESVSDHRLSAFLDSYAHAGLETSSDGRDLAQYIKTLHANKDAAYGGSWKKRGEIASILPNIARKVDRLSQYAQAGSVLSGESITDTGVDLFVYLVKYRLYLMDSTTELSPLLPNFLGPYSDKLECFNAVVDSYLLGEAINSSWHEIAKQVISAFEELYELANGGASVVTRDAKAASLCDLSFSLVRQLVAEFPSSSKQVTAAVRA